MVITGELLQNLRYLWPERVIGVSRVFDRMFKCMGVCSDGSLPAVFEDRASTSRLPFLEHRNTNIVGLDRTAGHIGLRKLHLVLVRELGPA